MKANRALVARGEPFAGGKKCKGIANSGLILDTRESAVDPSGMLKLPHTKSCFVCGLHNPAGLRLDFETDGNIVQARFLPRPEHAGFRQTVHGGILMTVLDEVMVWAVGVRTRRFAYSAEIQVRFVQQARPGEELLAVGELIQNRRNRLFETRGELRNQAGQSVATATGKYLPVGEDALADLLDDFAESTENLFR
jgi:acyl-coenzyme A thioesterase PaaI-like protein